MTLGRAFEREIYEQPAVWERVANDASAQSLADEFHGDLVLVGSGSSLFAAEIGALALRRRGVSATAVAATEVRADHAAFVGRTTIAVSQSGRSTDVLLALDRLRPARTIAITNSIRSPLAQRADVTIDIGAGVEEAVPATKSVTATVAMLLRAARTFGGDGASDRHELLRAAEAARAFLADGATLEMARDLAAQMTRARDVVILGTDYGAAVAREAALKFKESTYLHAEGFAAGEFRHGSAAMVDATTTAIGIVDEDGRAVVEPPLRGALERDAMAIAIGAPLLDGIPAFGPRLAPAYDVLGWLVAIHLLALEIGRARGIDSDRPRGLTKAIVAE